MTGRARIGGLSRQQHVWSVIHASAKPMTQREVFIACETLGYTLHQIDHHLRRLFECSAVRRERQRFKGSSRYVYRTVGRMPPDLRLGDDKRRAAERAKWGMDNADNHADNWGGDRCVRKKPTAADLPAIPSLADLLAR